ncbi:SDR family oxidoreductase [Candidatus Thorarchaeota archaeon]|nr:MAG: SDR family oxidoreductase [Candidatus Thorarchaeota archaeon]
MMPMESQQMKGKTVVVTGSNSGIGKETAKELARRGARVVMVVRSAERSTDAMQEIIEQSGNQDIHMLIADLSVMGEVRSVAHEFISKFDRLDILVNNAGAVFGERKLTSEGYERTTALNYLAPFLLTHELLDLLIQSSPARIVNVSSGAQSLGRIDIENINYEKDYGTMKAYGTSKLMLTMHTNWLARKLQGTGVTANAAHPGFVNTNFGEKNTGLGMRILLKISRPFQKSPEEGAETPIYVAASSEVKGLSGEFFADRERKDLPDEVKNEELQERLWRTTEELLGTNYDEKLSRLKAATP